MRGIHLAGIASVFVVALGVGYACADEVLRVELVRTAPATTNWTFSVTGEIQAVDSVPVGAKEGGRLLAINVEVGDAVGEGQVLAELDPTQANEAMRAAAADLVAAEASLKQANQAYERARDLLARGAGTRADHDTAVEALDAARSQRAQMAAKLSKAKRSVADVVIRADGPAIVTERNAEPGQVVNAAQTLLTLAREERREAIFHTPDGMDLTPMLGREITITTLDAPFVTAKAKVTEIAPVTEATSSTVKLTARLESGPQPALGAAISSDISIELGEGYTVPWSSLALMDGQPAVWVASPDAQAAAGDANQDMSGEGFRVALRPVTVSRYRDQSLEISSGLNAGDIVVGAGSHLLYPGQLVHAVGEIK
jgi:RND family efflux transporter MFP subunit